MSPKIAHFGFHGSSRPLLLIRPLDPLPAAATVDVRFPTSLTGGGSGAMNVLDPSMPVGFAVGDCRAWR